MNLSKRTVTLSKIFKVWGSVGGRGLGPACTCVPAKEGWLSLSCGSAYARKTAACLSLGCKLPCVVLGSSEK